MADVDTTLRARKPEVRIDVDRLAASDLGVSISDIASAMRTLVGGEIVTDYKDDVNGENYDVWLRAIGTDRDDAAVLGDLSLRSAKGDLVRLGSIAKVHEAIGPSQIDRAQRQRKISIIANLAGSPMGTVFEQFNAAFHKVEAPPLYRFTPVDGPRTSRTRSPRSSSRSCCRSAHAQSWRRSSRATHPIVILLAVPLTIPFALVSLLAPATTDAVLGAQPVLLFGIVKKKNGILQIDFHERAAPHAAGGSGSGARRVAGRHSTATALASSAGSAGSARTGARAWAIHQPP
jgi:HAE1 family hydrophobic/amphiphilic exporter-1